MIKCRLREMLEIKKTTIQNIHDHTKINLQTLTKLSNNQLVRIDLKTIEQLCKMFGCSVGDLFFIDDL